MTCAILLGNFVFVVAVSAAVNELSYAECSANAKGMVLVQARKSPGSTHTHSAGRGQCSLAYAAHSGFGNQLRGLQRAAWVAKAAGCLVEIPPVLEHYDLEYGQKGCAKDYNHERKLWSDAFDLYKDRALQYEHVFVLSPSLRARSIDVVSPDAREFLALDCRDFKGHETNKTHLKTLMQPNSGAGSSYAMGSGMVSLAPMLRLPELFTDFAPKVRAAVRVLKDHLNGQDSASNGKYGCIHLRLDDSELVAGKGTHDKSTSKIKLQKWIGRHLLPNTSMQRMPLFLMSGMEKDVSHDIVRSICLETQSPWSSCKTLPEVLPSFSTLDLGIPDSAKKNFQQLLLELGLCAGASEIFLPNIQTVISGREVQILRHEHAGVHNSTLDTLVRDAHAAFQPV